MVGVVGSSPIAPTNILLHIKHLVVTLGAFLLGPFNWGQININYQLKRIKAKGASSYWGTRNRSAPLAFIHFN